MILGNIFYFLLEAFLLINFVKSAIVLNQTSKFKLTPVSSCKAELEDGRLLDLSSLDKPSSPRVATKDDYNYKFNPCSPITCVKGVKATAAVCQVTTSGTFSYNCGDQSSAVLAYDGNVFSITYSSGSKVSKLNCLCGKTESFEFTSESPKENYNLVFTSPCCCPDGCSGKKPSGGGSGGLSFGSVLLIIFFSLLVAYFLGGFIFLKFVRKSEGKETIPNINFWVQLPSDVKSGVSFTISKIRGNGKNYNQF